MELEWDEEKRATNVRVHGVDFLAASLVFESPMLERVILHDARLPNPYHQRHESQQT